MRNFFQRPVGIALWLLASMLIVALLASFLLWLSVGTRSPILLEVLGVVAALAVPFSVAMQGWLKIKIDQSLDEQIAKARQELGEPAEVWEQSQPRVVATEGGGKTVVSIMPSLFAASRVQPAWDLALATLEKYWARNLNQNGFIFVASIIASALGFSVTLWGIYAAINGHDDAGFKSGVLAATSGAVTQIIGATFLVIYKSTAQQGLEYNRTLERINSVGMAWYVLQTMSEETDVHRKAKDAAKAALVLSVIVSGGNVSAKGDSTADKSDQDTK